MAPAPVEEPEAPACPCSAWTCISISIILVSVATMVIIGSQPSCLGPTDLLADSFICYQD